jgi:hypothetical protein
LGANAGTKPQTEGTPWVGTNVTVPVVTTANMAVDAGGNISVVTSTIAPDSMPMLTTVLETAG